MSEMYPPPPPPTGDQHPQYPGTDTGQTPFPPSDSAYQPFPPQQPPTQPAMPSQPLYPQQPPAGYAGYPGGAPASPTYVRTNLGEYWKNARNGKRNLSILAVVVVLMFLCSGVSTALGESNLNSYSKALVATEHNSTPASNQSTATSQPTTASASNGTVALYKASATSVTIAEIAKNPDAYKGQDVTFTAVIDSFAQDSSGNTAAANVVDPNDGSSVIQIGFTPGFSVSHVNKGDTITVWGSGLGAFSGANANGDTVTEGAVLEVYLDDSTSGYSDTTVTDPATYIASGSN